MKNAINQKIQISFKLRACGRKLLVISRHDGLDENNCAMDQREWREDLQGIATQALNTIQPNQQAALAPDAGKEQQ